MSSPGRQADPRVERSFPSSSSASSSPPFLIESRMKGWIGRGGGGRDDRCEGHEGREAEGRGNEGIIYIKKNRGGSKQKGE